MATKNKTLSKKKTVTEVTVKTKEAQKSLFSLVNPTFIRNLVIVLLVGVTVFLIAKKYRGLIIAGTVNTTPISRFQLNQKLNERYGKTTLEEMINTAFLKDLMKQNDLTVTADDLKSERQRLIDQVGGEENLKAALTQYGMTETDLTDRLESVIMERKLSDKNFPVEVTDTEIEEYFQNNEASFEGKTLDEVKEDIRSSLKLQKQQQEFSTWFQEQKDKAQINTYI